MKELSMHNGDVRDADTVPCHACNQPVSTADRTEGIDGEWYHPDCLPEYLKP